MFQPGPNDEPPPRRGGRCRPGTRPGTTTAPNTSGGFNFSNTTAEQAAFNPPSSMGTFANTTARPQAASNNYAPYGGAYQNPGFGYDDQEDSPEQQLQQENQAALNAAAFNADAQTDALLEQLEAEEEEGFQQVQQVQQVQQGQQNQQNQQSYQTSEQDLRMWAEQDFIPVENFQQEEVNQVPYPNLEEANLQEERILYQHHMNLEVPENDSFALIQADQARAEARVLEEMLPPPEPPAREPLREESFAIRMVRLLGLLPRQPDTRGREPLSEELLAIRAAQSKIAKRSNYRRFKLEQEAARNLQGEYLEDWMELYARRKKRSGLALQAQLFPIFRYGVAMEEDVPVSNRPEPHAIMIGAFPGTGKTHFVQQYNAGAFRSQQHTYSNYTFAECDIRLWRDQPGTNGTVRNADFPHNYVAELERLYRRPSRRPNEPYNPQNPRKVILFTRTAEVDALLFKTFESINDGFYRYGGMRISTVYPGQENEAEYLKRHQKEVEDGKAYYEGRAVLGTEEAIPMSEAERKLLKRHFGTVLSGYRQLRASWQYEVGAREYLWHAMPEILFDRARIPVKKSKSPFLPSPAGFTGLAGLAGL